MRYVRHADLVALVLALPLFVALGAPLVGYALGAGIWLVQKAMQVAFERRIRGSDDPKTVVGFTAGGAIARAWLAAASVLAIGLVLGDEVGLSAVLLILGLFTVYFAGRVFERLAETMADAGGEG